MVHVHRLREWSPCTGPAAANHANSASLFRSSALCEVATARPPAPPAEHYRHAYHARSRAPESGAGRERD
ncbi:unnamed protein product [Boreogadus saida]